MMKNGILTFLFAFFPGAGQMYQGYMKRGLSLVTMFCLLCMGFFLGPLGLASLIVWMYSFFDTFNLRAQLSTDTAPEDDYLIHLDPEDRRMRQLLKESHKLLGWALITLGVMVFYQSVIMQTLGELFWKLGKNSAVFSALYRVLDSLPEVVVCAALVVCGVWLVRGPRDSHKASSKDVPPEDLCEYGAETTEQEPSEILPVRTDLPEENAVTEENGHD